MASLAFPSLAKQAKLSDGTRYGYVYIPARPGRPTLLFLHGFPSSSHDWRHQISDLPKLGYGVLAPDLLGYGDTDKPLEVEAYALKNIGRHVDELLALEGLERVIGVGHDYGSVLLSHLAVYYKHRFDGVFFAAIGFVDPAGQFDLETLRAVNAETKQRLGASTSGYIELFVRDDAAAILEAASASVDSLLYPADPAVWRDTLGPQDAYEAFLKAGRTVPRADYISPEEVEMHAEIMARGGYAAPLNWQVSRRVPRADKASRRAWAVEADKSATRYKRFVFVGPSDEDKALTDTDKEFSAPTMYLVCDNDWVANEQWHVQETTRFAKNLELVRLPSSHWVMLEKRKEFNEILDAWISRI